MNPRLFAHEAKLLPLHQYQPSMIPMPVPVPQSKHPKLFRLDRDGMSRVRRFYQSCLSPATTRLFLTKKVSADVDDRKKKFPAGNFSFSRPAFDFDVCVVDPQKYKISLLSSERYGVGWAKGAPRRCRDGSRRRRRRHHHN